MGQLQNNTRQPALGYTPPPSAENASERENSMQPDERTKPNGSQENSDIQ